MTFQKYSNCRCVMYNFTADDIANSKYWQAEEGKCRNDCPYLPYFLPVFAIMMVGIFITSMPALSASLRYAIVFHHPGTSLRSIT